MAAVIMDQERAERLREIRVPFLVLHGSDDPLIPVACGEDTARRVPGSSWVVIDGMGHDVTRANAPLVADQLVAFASANDA